MELVFVVVFGAGLGALVRYTMPERLSYGAALMPALGLAAAAIGWVGLTWLGMLWDGGWIWVISLTLALLVPLATAYLLPKHRAKADEELLARLSAP